MYFRILFFNYLKSFLLIFISLISFFIFIDFMINKDRLPDSTNLQVLYIFYNGMNAALLIYPLALLLGVLATIITLVKKNEMIAFLSIGYSFKHLLKPIFSVAFIITTFFILLQGVINTSFSDQAKSIISGKYFSNVNKNLFFKFNDNIIFIKKLDVLHKTAYDMKVFFMKKNKLVYIYDIKKAIFKNNTWQSDEIIAHVLTNKAIITKKIKIEILKGFKPDILNKLESKVYMTLKIALQALYLLKKENMNVNFIKTYIYNAIIPPLSFILLIVIIFLKAPIHSRISNISLYIAVSLFSGIVLWSLFLLVKKMAVSGIVCADIAFITPFIILLGLAIYYFRKI